METETKNMGTDLPCPQCRALMPAAGRQCLACGAEMHATCPDCDTPRGADDAFCRKCGFNFSLRKLRLKDRPAAAASAPHAPSGQPLPQVEFHKPGKRYAYRMNPRMGRIRAFFVLIFLLLIAAGVFVVFNVIWGNLSVKDIRGLCERVSSAVPDRVAVVNKKTEPDWKVRYQYWLGYYRDVFTRPPTNTLVEVGLTTGAREQGVLVRVASGSVILQQAGKECDYPRLALDDATRRIFFNDEFVAFNAKNRVRAEKSEWEQKIKAAAAGSNAASGLLVAPASGAVPAAVTFLDVKCPACAGMGYLVEAGGAQRGTGGLSSGEGIGRTGGGVALQQGTQIKPAMARTGKQICPVCGGKGLRRFERVPDFPWPAGAARCGPCQGMGKMLIKSEQGLNQGITCSTCDGRGFGVNQYDAAQNVPPRYE